MILHCDGIYQASSSRGGLDALLGKGLGSFALLFVIFLFFSFVIGAGFRRQGFVDSVALELFVGITSALILEHIMLTV